MARKTKIRIIIVNVDLLLFMAASCRIVLFFMMFPLTPAPSRRREKVGPSLEGRGFFRKVVAELKVAQK